MQPDPIGYRGGSHLCAYVSNDPLNFADPNGFAAEGFGAGFNAAFTGNDTNLLSNVIPNGSTAARVGAGLGFATGFVSNIAVEIGAFAVGEGALNAAFGVGARAAEEAGTAAIASGGRLGSAATRAQISSIAADFESQGYTVTGGGGRLPETYIPGPGGGPTGSAYPDITLTSPSGNTVYVNTVDTLQNGITPTAREIRNATKIESLTGTPVILIPKP